ncbi:MAG: hypothetical protein ACK5MK_00720 [Dysgonomonas sp.]
MKKIVALVLILFCSISIVFCQTTQTEKVSDMYPFKSWGIGVNAGTNGVGGNIITKINPHLVARVGFDYMKYDYKPDDMELDVEYEGQELEAKVNSVKLKFPNAKLLIDYYPMKNGIFSITGGLYFGQNKVTMEGYASQKFELDDIVIEPDENGYFDASLVLGNTVKPYLGIGLGRTLASKKIGFRFELGVIYQGHYKIESDYMADETVSKANNAIEDEIPKSLLDFWPVLNFNLSYRFK